MRLPRWTRRRSLALAAVALAATTTGTALAITAWTPGPNGIVNAHCLDSELLNKSSYR